MASLLSGWAEMTKLVAVTCKGVIKQNLKHGGADQYFKKHMPIVFSANYALKFVLAG